MALQGTLDTFELPDVLRLLSSTKKTGRLRLSTDRGDGGVWVSEGMVVGVDTSAGMVEDLSEGMFDLLRAREGHFAFDPEQVHGSPAAPTHVEPLLAAAEERLIEWREIEKVVPSMRAWVGLADELPAPEVTIDANAWRTVTAIAGGITVDELGRALDLTEVGVCRLVRDLVTLGLASVTDDAPAGAASAGADWSSMATDRFQPIQFADEQPPAEPEPTPAPEPAAEVAPAPAPAPAPEPAPAPAVDLADDGGELDDDEADEVARQLAKLSPRAAQAVAAAAAAETEAERDAALDLLDDGNEEVNRGLLLKFLGSVKG
jgi:hypothetical protein